MTTQSNDPDPAHLAARPETFDEADPTAAARSFLRNSAPSDNLGTILEMERHSHELDTMRNRFFGGIEDLTGLRAVELQTLVVIAGGAEHHRDIARRTGQADAAAAATLEGLLRHGLVARHHHPSEPNPDAEPTLVHLTARGTAILGQSEAIRVRLLDTVVDSLGGADLETVQATADALQRSLSGVAAVPSRQIGGAG